MWKWILDRFILPRLAPYECDAIAQADARNIGERGTRGEDNARDAFRHAYVSARMVAEYGTSSRGIIRMLGEQLEAHHLSSRCPATPHSSAMDITNNAHGTRYDPASKESPADYAHRLLKAGVLITRPEDAPQIPWVNAAAEMQAKVCAR